MKRIVIGILAHVDSGKTTLSEGLLYRAGAVRRLGRVDHGDAFLDTAALEKARGITIFAKQAELQVGDTVLTLVDTPGHVDFSAEMERTLQVLDYAVLVVSGTDGVQSHTETLWRLLRRYQVPTLLFVNKMDLAGADHDALLAQLKRRLGEGCVDFSALPAARDEALALCDEALMEQYLAAGSLTPAAVADAVARRSVFPCWFGAALKLEGVDALLDGLAHYTRAPVALADFGARVFKIGADDTGARLTYMKITGGSLPVKTQLCARPGAPAWSEKADQLRVYSGARFHTVETALPGMIVAVTGLTKTRPGEGLGAQPDAADPVLEPVLSYRVQLPEGADVHTALGQLRRLEEEDPQLHVVWRESLGEIHVQLMGEVQLEVLQSLIAERYGLEVRFGEGGILYKETIARAAEGVGHYEPLRHYAEVHLLLEPGAQGSGIQLATACREDALDKNWQRLILTHLAEKQHLGVLAGAPLTDVKITLLAGRAHLKHTEGGDFRQATYRAVRQGLRSTQGVLLEPWYTFRLELPTETVGRAMSDIQRLAGSFEPAQTLGETAVLTGRAPVATLRGYQREVTGYTRGRGRLSCTLCGYAPCHNADEVLAAIGYDPDRDLDNPADSVFCSHGAGYVVKWDAVRSQMHLDTGWGKPATADTPEPVSARRVAAYCGTLAEDKELLAIFEHTYGPIKRSGKDAARRAFRPAEKPAAPPPPPLPAGPEYLLVDGYNIIHAWDDLAALAADNLAAARCRLMDILCNYQGYRQCRLILVFDAYKIKGNPGTVEQYHNISVVYTREAETADMYIEKVTHELGRSYRVRVATSDGVEQIIILGQGALRLSARAFRMEVDEVEKAIRACLDGPAQ